MSRPVRRGRLDLLDRVRPGLADRVRSALAASTPGRLRSPAARTRAAGLAAAAAVVAGRADTPDTPHTGDTRAAQGAAAGLETALTARLRWPGPVADRLVVSASGRVRAAGAPAPTAPGLSGVPADEAVRLAERLAGRLAAGRPAAGPGPVEGTGGPVRPC